MRLRGKPTQGLDFPQVVDLVEGVEVGFHALDGDVLAGLDALRLEDFAESAFSLLRDQPVLCLYATVHAS